MKIVPLGPGILFHQSDGQVFKIEIDLRKEIPLGSDLKPTGRIKRKDFKQYLISFWRSFLDTYNDYMDLSGR